MPRSLALAAAETMLTSDSSGRSTPASAAAVSGLVLSVGHLARILEAHALDAGLGELAGEQPELLGELDPGPQARRLLGGDVGEVDGIGDGALEQVVGHLLGDLQGDVLLRLARGGAQVRRADDVGQAEQRAVLGRLDLEHVEGGAGHVARLQRLRPAPARRPGRRARS